MSAEIVEAVKTLGREKGISEEKLMGALEDALLSAYKKQPGAARYARVRMDRDSGDFIVEEFLLPESLYGFDDLSGHVPQSPTRFERWMSA